MNLRRRFFRVLTIILWLACLALAGLALYYSLSIGSDSLTFTIVYVIMFLAFASVGAFVAYNRLNNPIGWMFIVVALSNIIWTVAYNNLQLRIAANQYPLPVLLIWASGSTISDIGWALMPTLVLILFPDGRLPDRNWRALAWVNGFLFAITMLINVFTPGPAVPELLPAEYQNPFGLHSLVPYVNVLKNIYAVIPVITIVNVIFIVRRYRRAQNEERLRYKWFAFAGVVLLLLLLFGGVRNFISIPWSEEVVYFLFPLGVALLPVSVGVAILRYRLYDIDLIINRALVYGSLTLALTLIYFGTVSLLQALLQALSGARSNVAIVVSTLAIAALFSPLRRLLQGWIDRRFFRQQYDASHVLHAFNSRLRDAVDVEIIAGELKTAVGESVQPVQVSLWLRPLSASSEKQNPTDLVN